MTYIGFAREMKDEKYTNALLHATSALIAPFSSKTKSRQPATSHVHATIYGYSNALRLHLANECAA